MVVGRAKGFAICDLRLFNEIYDWGFVSWYYGQVLTELFSANVAISFRDCTTWSTNP
jgi:hypothetical protein